MSDPSVDTSKDKAEAKRKRAAKRRARENRYAPMLWKISQLKKMPNASSFGADVIFPYGSATVNIRTLTTTTKATDRQLAIKERLAKILDCDVVDASPTKITPDVSRKMRDSLIGYCYHMETKQWMMAFYTGPPGECRLVGTVKRYWSAVAEQLLPYFHAHNENPKSHVDRWKLLVRYHRKHGGERRFVMHDDGFQPGGAYPIDVAGATIHPPDDVRYVASKWKTTAAGHAYRDEFYQKQQASEASTQSKNEPPSKTKTTSKKRSRSVDTPASVSADVAEGASPLKRAKKTPVVPAETKKKKANTTTAPATSPDRVLPKGALTAAQVKAWGLPLVDRGARLRDRIAGSTPAHLYQISGLKANRLQPLIDKRAELSQTSNNPIEENDILLPLLAQSLKEINQARFDEMVMDVLHPSDPDLRKRIDAARVQGAFGELVADPKFQRMVTQYAASLSKLLLYASLTRGERPFRAGT